jgi:uncharacterized coiled-coil protein SlyX
MTKQDRIVELEARVAELEATIERMKTIAGNGIQDNLAASQHNMTMLVWGLESMQKGFVPGEVDWLYIMRDITRTIFALQSAENLVDDITGMEV